MGYPRLLFPCLNILGLGCFLISKSFQTLSILFLACSLLVPFPHFISFRSVSVLSLSAVFLEISWLSGTLSAMALACSLHYSYTVITLAEDDDDASWSDRLVHACVALAVLLSYLETMYEWEPLSVSILLLVFCLPNLYFYEEPLKKSSLKPIPNKFLYIVTPLLDLTGSYVAGYALGICLSRCKVLIISRPIRYLLAGLLILIQMEAERTVLKQLFRLLRAALAYTPHNDQHFLQCIYVLGVVAVKAKWPSYVEIYILGGSLCLSLFFWKCAEKKEKDTPLLKDMQEMEGR